VQYAVYVNPFILGEVKGREGKRSAGRVTVKLLGGWLRYIHLQILTAASKMATYRTYQKREHVESKAEWLVTVVA